MSAYRTAAEPAEPPFEADAYALSAPDDDTAVAIDEVGVPSVLMRAEDFVNPHTGRSHDWGMLMVLLTIVGIAAVPPLAMALVWLVERFL